MNRFIPLLALFLLADAPFDGPHSTALQSPGPRNLSIANYTMNVVSVAATACTLSATNGCSGGNDCGTLLRMTGASPVITIPATLGQGCQVAIEQDGSTQVSVAGSAVTAATLRLPHSFAGKTAAQYSTIGVTVLSNTSGTNAVALFTGDGA